MSSDAAAKTFSWSPLTLTSDPYAVLLLNQPIQLAVSTFRNLWNEATFRICVDGGNNQLYDFAQKHGLENDLLTPNLVTGDFDSIRRQVKEHYARLGAKIVETEDQNFTDFTKSLMELFAGISRHEYPKVKSVLVINEPSGRHDQFFANISTLCRFRDSEIPVFIVSEESICWILAKGSHSVQLDQVYPAGRPYCGLIPLQGRTVMKTEGLRWDLNEGMVSSFAPDPEGMVSTSNEVAADRLKIVTDKDILWTMKSFY